jgi:hypothetical protein
MELQHGCRASAYVKFAVDIFKVPTDGTRAQAETVGNFFVGQSMRE